MNAIVLAVACLPLAFLAGIAGAELIGTSFTYQGQLTDSNEAAEGPYDFSFGLYDADVNGTELADVNLADVDVIDGLFTVELDFGSSVFDGNSVWLEVGVRAGELDDPNEYFILSPRQSLRATPYALQTRGIFVDQSGKAGVGTTTPSNRLDVAGNINSSGSYRLDGDTVLSNVGTENILLGLGAGASLTTGSGNSALGYNALNNNTTGFYNTGVGIFALKANSDGILNTAIGSFALENNTLGSFNCALGISTLSECTIAYYNTAVGAFALQYSQTGFSNSALGTYSLWKNLTGADNVAVGYKTLSENVGGSRNTAIGTEAGYLNGWGSGNVFLGFKAGYNETGSDKLYVANSDANVPLIYGEFDTGRIGLGTNEPKRTLHVSDVLRLEPRSDFPGDPNDGDICIVGQSGNRNIYCYLNGDWRELLPASPP